MAGRSLSPEQTLINVEPLAREFGVTRLARQTNLDRLGLPCFSAIRPNAKSLAASQGKGLTDAAAQASAVMEAIEFAVAETIAEHQSTSGCRPSIIYDAQRLRPMGTPGCDAFDGPLRSGLNLIGPGEVGVPLEVLTLDPELPRPLQTCRTTNGLASGNTIDEALVHGICELIERDATTLASLNSLPFGRRLCAVPKHCRTLDLLMKGIKRKGFDVWIFDQTTDIKVPVVMAIILAPRQSTLFAIAAGYGCDLSFEGAAIRAITEAAQTRITNIAGARDDFHPQEYRTPLPDGLLHLIMQHPEGEPPQDYVCAHDADTLGTLCSALAQCGIQDLTYVTLLDHPAASVVRVLSRDLEDRYVNPNWRPGWRAIEALRSLAA